MIIKLTWLYSVFDAAFEENPLHELEASRNDANPSFPAVSQKFIFSLVSRVSKVSSAEIYSERRKMIIFGISIIFSTERCFAGLNLSFLIILPLCG